LRASSNSNIREPTLRRREQRGREFRRNRRVRRRHRVRPGDRQLRRTLSSGGSDDIFVAKFSAAGAYDAFIAKFDGAGAHVSSRRYGDGSSQVANCVAIDPSDKLVVVGDRRFLER